ncbi:MAG: hypothetical protein Kow0069_11060 [Promethearchaeota archaeon]
MPPTMENGQNPFFEDAEALYEVLSIVQNRDLNEDQKAVYEHGNGPLWIIAGPGSGKTEVLCWRVLKLLLVDAVPPQSLFVTTFTEKAADNLVTRLTTMLALLGEHANVEFEIDLQGAWVGTLHSLANRVLTAYRYPEYQNLRLMDEFEQRFFALRHCTFMNSQMADKPGFSREFWEAFAINPHDRQARLRYGLSLLNRVVEDHLDLERMRASNVAHVRELVAFYDEYVERMREQARCDYAHLQLYFLNFLATDQGELFLKGNGDDVPGIRHVLVDEYQDTNPIQEAIYFALASPSGNLTVVGDDDQAMYRFRGASVDHLVHFGQRCRENLNRDPTVVQLRSNYRSHPGIVRFFNYYISEHYNLGEKARAPRKQPMIPASPLNGDYQPVVALVGGNNKHRASAIASMIKHLIDRGKVVDPSDVAVLFRSTRETRRYAKHLVDALGELGIPYHNPRSRSVQDDPRVQQLLGVVLQLLDPEDLTDMGFDHQNGGVYQIREEGRRVIRENRPLATFVENSRRNLESMKPSTWTKTNLLDLFFNLLNLPPFCSYLHDAVTCSRFALLSQLFEAFMSVHHYSLPIGEREVGSGVAENFVRTFYSSFLDTILSGGLNELESDEPLPRGHVQIMTYHQAKGLEFPYVFLMNLGNAPKPGLAHVAEAELSAFRRGRVELITAEERAAHDQIRLLYVGMSRAMVGLVLDVGAFGRKMLNSLGPFAYQADFKRYGKVLKV